MPAQAKTKPTTKPTSQPMRQPTFGPTKKLRASQHRSCVRWLRESIVLVALLGPLAIGDSAIASPPRGGSSARERAPTEAEIVALFEKKEYAKALELIDRALASKPGDPLMHYNAACALALLGRVDDAAARLMLAVKYGFRDFQHLERDEDIAALRGHPTYKAILEAKESAGRDAAKIEVERWRARFGSDRYRYEQDEELNLHFATALDERMHRRMIRMLQAQAREQIAALFDGAPKEAVFIAIPTRSDSKTFFADLAERDKTFDHPNIAGIYEHRPRRLVSADVGASLRHEFTHAMHYGDMERLGQAHPLWIQEGLATLYEDYDLAADDRILFTPNDRDEAIRELVAANQALAWRRLMALSAEEFMKRPQQMYPQVRSMFRFLATRGKLGEWYHAYTRSFAGDRSGAAAFEEVLGAKLPEIERQWREWVLGRGVRDPIGDGTPRRNAPIEGGTTLPTPAPPMPSRPAPSIDAPVRVALGLSLEDRDGPRITRVQPGSAAAAAGLRIDDVILSIDGVATPRVSDAVAATVRRAAGHSVEIVARRDTEYLRVRVEIAASGTAAPR